MQHSRLRAGLIAGALTVAFAPMALADAVSDFYSGNRITFIVGSPPGGAYDLYSRTFGEHFGKHVPGHPSVIVTYMQGGAGSKAANYIYNVSPRDGSVMGLVEQGVPVAKALRDDPGMKFDVTKFNWIGTIASSYYIISVWHTTPIKTIDDARKQQVLLSATGKGSTTNYYPLLVNAVAGTKFKPVVGYKGAGGMNMAIERGETWGRGGTYTSWTTATADWVRDKKIRFILQIGAEKHPDLPNVPLLLDLAKNQRDREMVEFMSVPTRVGRSIFTPPKVPADRVAALRKAFDETMKDPGFIADAKKRHLHPTGQPGVQLQAIMAKLVKTSPEMLEHIRKATGLKKVKR